jgi:HK97 gp10 family phage protein
MIETYGFDALEKTFENFQYKDKRAIFLSAYRKATKPMVEQARQNAPMSTGRTAGTLKKSMGMVPMQDRIGVWVGARVTGGSKGFHAHLVENGTVERFYRTKKGVQHRTGKMNPNAGYARFFQKAFDATQKEALDTITEEWYKAIERFIVRSKKKDA